MPRWTFAFSNQQRLQAKNMASVSTTSGAKSSTNNSSISSQNKLNDVNTDDFLKLMIAELQNQDPLNPLNNDQLIAQIGQIRSVAATDKLSSTLDTVLLGQNISSATNLIGAEVDGISDDQQKVTGRVARVSVTDGQPKLHLDLNPHAESSNESGDIAAGDYQYRVTWSDDAGNLVGVDPLAASGGKISLSGDPHSVLLSNLPESNSAKQVFRREGSDGDFHLVGDITNGKQSTFLDSTATEDLSDYVLSGDPALVVPTREFIVSLKNVGEIRPPASVSP
jgi:flagellar basal-body rod modification protein FlgD